MSAHPLLTRAHLEATLVGTAACRHDMAPYILERVDRDRISIAAWGLLAQLADQSTDFRRRQGDIHCETKAQRALADRVDAVTVGDMTFWPLETLIALVNQLPERESRQTAWERDLERGCNAA